MNVETLQDHFVTELQQVYGMESDLLDALDSLKQDANVDALDDLRVPEPREALTEVLDQHRTETERQIERLETAFETIDHRAERRSAPALGGLLDEKELFNNIVLSDETRPLYYLRTAKQVERMEITAYEHLLLVGEHLGMPDTVIEALEQNLEEERATLQALQDIADGEEIGTLLDGLAATSGDMAPDDANAGVAE